MRAPGEVHHTGGKRLILGEPDNSSSERLLGVCDALDRAGFETVRSTNIRLDIWTKLIGNLSFNPIAALTGYLMNEIVADEQVLDVIRAMAVFLYGSLSPDSPVIAATFLFTALMTRGCLLGRWTAGEVVTSIASALVFCMLKPVYAPLLLLGLPAAFRRENRKHALAVVALVCGTALGATALWLTYASSAQVLPKPGTNVAEQLAFITGSPSGYARFLYWTLLRRWPDYYDQTIGLLGWLNVRLPEFAYLLPLAGLVFSIPAQCSQGQRLPHHGGS